MDILHRRARQKANKENAKKRAKEFVAEYFASHPCVDCGESDPIVLTFDHIPREHTKRGNISDMIQNGLGLESIKAEIAKTEVVCHNCHSLREQARTGAYRFRMGKVGKLL